MDTSKFKYGLKEYFRPTPSKVKRLLLAWKGIIASSAVVALADSDWKLAVLIGIVGFIVNEAAMFVGENPHLFAVERAKEAIKDTVTEAANEIKAEEAEPDYCKLAADLKAEINAGFINDYSIAEDSAYPQRELYATEKEYCKALYTFLLSYKTS